jgi:rhomboid protease GluP
MSRPAQPTRTTAAAQAAGPPSLLPDRSKQAPVTLLLITTNVVVFLLMLGAGAGLWHGVTGVQLAWGANFGPATQDGQWWRLGSAMFLHFGLLHLALNMWALWDVGRLIERLFGRLRFGTLYLASGILGNLLSLVMQGNQAISAGASGAVFSLYGALLVFLWRERRQVEVSEFRWLFGAATVFSAVTLGMGLIIPGIDNAAHLGGLIGGALLGIVLARPWAATSKPAGSERWVACAMLAAAVATLLWLLPPPSYRLGEELRAQAAIRQFLDEDQRLSQRWGSLLNAGQTKSISFDQMAGSLDDRITAGYQQSFEQLSALQLDPAAPSAKALDEIRRYAALRGEASHALAEGLRARDASKVSKALEQARLAPARARQASAPAPSASAAR